MTRKTYTKDGVIVITGLLIEAGGKPTTSGGDVIDLKGMTLNRRIYVTKDFGNNVSDIIGELKHAEVVPERGLVADIVLNKDVITGWPAIGGIVRERAQEGKVVTKFDLTTVSICGVQNADHNIPPIQIQIKEIKDERQKNTLKQPPPTSE